MTIVKPLATVSAPTELPPTGAREPIAEQSAASRQVFILDCDADLGAHLDPAVFARARRLLRAPLLSFACGEPDLPACDPRTSFGLLVLSGLMGRRIRIGGAHATELLGPGDILRPWDSWEHGESMPPEIDWRVFKPVRIAVLDAQVTQIIGCRPELVVSFSGRLLNRVTCSSYLRAVSHLTRVDARILVTLWHLASRWGVVTADGVVIPFRLTHEVLGEIVGAQRPSVTLALGRMRRTGIVQRRADGALTLMQPPGSVSRKPADGATETSTDALGVRAS